MYDWSDRCDLCWNSKFKTDKGIFIVTGVHFKQGIRVGLYVVNENGLGRVDAKFIEESKLIQMEKENKFKIL